MEELASLQIADMLRGKQVNAFIFGTWSDQGPLVWSAPHCHAQILILSSGEGWGVFPKMLAVLRGTHQQVKDWARRVEEAGLTAPGCGHPRNPNRESWAPQTHPHRAHALFRKETTLVWWVRNKGSSALL